MGLTTTQIKQLRALGQQLRDDVRLGKAGLSEGAARNLQDLLARHEMVKVRFTDIEGPERKVFAEELAEAVDAQLVGVTGRTLLLYRPNPELDADQRILQ